MPIRKVDALEEGDILAGDIANAQGVVLVKAGAAIKAAHIRLFELWGVLTVQVADAGSGGGRTKEVTEEHREKAQADLKALFGASLEGEIMEEVFRVAAEMRAAKLASGEIDERD